MTALVTLCSLPGAGAIPARGCALPLLPGHALGWLDVSPVSDIVPLLWWVQRAAFHPQAEPCLPLPQRAADRGVCAGASPLVLSGSGQGDGERSESPFQGRTNFRRRSAFRIQSGHVSGENAAA